jgi:hypothetical protein
MNPDRQGILCSYCKRPNATQCGEERCYRSAHPFCAQESKQWLLEVDGFVMMCPHHRHILALPAVDLTSAASTPAMTKKPYVAKSASPEDNLNDTPGVDQRRSLIESPVDNLVNTQDTAEIRCQKCTFLNSRTSSTCQVCEARFVAKKRELDSSEKRRQKKQKFASTRNAVRGLIQDEASCSDEV